MPDPDPERGDNDGPVPPGTPPIGTGVGKGKLPG
tara:strand:+ start:58 stop:159 length:102 start_codon:yes stop_codon:yes gene_type:complete